MLLCVSRPLFRQPLLPYIHRRLREEVNYVGKVRQNNENSEFENSNPATYMLLTCGLTSSRLAPMVIHYIGLRSICYYIFLLQCFLSITVPHSSLRWEKRVCSYTLRYWWCRVIRIQSRNANDRHKLRPHCRQPPTAGRSHTANQEHEGRESEALRLRLHGSQRAGQHGIRSGNKPTEWRDRSGSQKPFSGRPVGAPEHPSILSGNQDSWNLSWKRAFLIPFHATNMGAAPPSHHQHPHISCKTQLNQKHKNLHRRSPWLPCHILPSLGWCIPRGYHVAVPPTITEISVQLSVLLLCECVPILRMGEWPYAHPIELCLVWCFCPWSYRSRVSLLQLAGWAAGCGELCHGEGRVWPSAVGHQWNWMAYCWRQHPSGSECVECCDI